MIRTRPTPSTEPQRPRQRVRAESLSQINLTVAYCLVMGLSLFLVGGIAVASLTL